MRVLLINDHGRAYGGAELMVLSLKDRLQALGHDVRLFASRAEMIPGFPFLADCGCYGRDDLAQVALQSANPSAWWALRREIAEFPPDVVHIRSFLWMLSPLILPALQTVPVVHMAPTYKEICPNGQKLRPDRNLCEVKAGNVCKTSGCVSARTYRADRLQKRLLNRWRDAIDITSVLSHRAAEQFHAAGWDDVRVLHNPAVPRAQSARQGDVPRVSYVGRLSPEKGVDTLIDAFARTQKALPSARLTIIGTGPSEDALRAQAEDTGAPIEFLGHLPADKTDAHLAETWVQAVPSVWHEPFGNVTLEAMMRGTAVLGSDRGAIPEVVRHGETGLIAAGGDPDAWSNALFRLLSDRDLCIRMGKAGRNRADTEFSQDRHLEHVLDLYATAQRRFAARHDS